MLELLLSHRVDAQTLGFVALALAAWRWGAGPERALAAILLWFRLADWTYHGILEGALDLTNIDLAHALIDAVACAAALAVALYANRVYPLCFAAVQILALFAHLARAMAVEILPTAYAIMFITPSYLQMLLLGAGIWAHWRRVRRYGPYRSWRLSSSRLRAATPHGWPSG